MRGRFQRAGLTLAVGLLALTAAGAAQAQQAAIDRTAGPGPSPETPYLAYPDWDVEPRIDFPANALEAGLRQGRVAVDCAVRPSGALTDCRVTEETPGDLGLAQLTLDATSRARIANVDRNSPANLRVDFVAFFSAPAPSVRIGGDRAPPMIVPAPPRPAAAPTPRSTLVTLPAWARMPRGTLPEQAAARGLTEGFAGLRCRLEPNGALSECVVLSESTPGVGFGEAALAAASIARATPRTVDGAVPRAEVLVWVPVDRAPASAR